jgi:hypothetical protein
MSLRYPFQKMGVYLKRICAIRKIIGRGQFYDLGEANNLASIQKT